MYYLAYNEPRLTIEDPDPQVYGIFSSLVSIIDFLIRNELIYCFVQVFSIDRGITNFSWEDGKYIEVTMNQDTIKEISNKIRIK